MGGPGNGPPCPSLRGLFHRPAEVEAQLVGHQLGAALPPDQGGGRPGAGGAPRWANQRRSETSLGQKYVTNNKTLPRPMWEHAPG